MSENENKCKTCIRKYAYKTVTPCRYCKENKEYYWGRKESKMIEDNYRYAESDENSSIPY